MRFLKFWLVSIALTYIILKIAARACMNRLENAGHRFRRSESTTAEQLHTFLTCCVPFWNIILVLIMILMPTDKMDALMLNKFKEKDLLKEPEEW